MVRCPKSIRFTFFGLVMVWVLLWSVAIAKAGDDNWNGYGDSAIISSFKADSLKYSKQFKLSEYENLRVTVFANDTDATGFASDSLNFAWGIQTGHWAYTTTRTSSPVMDWAPRMVIDTFDILTSGNTVEQFFYVLNDLTFTTPLKYIDTTTFAGYAKQNRLISPEWDVYFRFWFKGLAGNNKASFIKLIAQAAQRRGVKTENSR